MQWNNHSLDVPEGAHAFLGASKYSWVNYDADKLISVYQNFLAAQRGTRIHAYAAESIRLGQKLPRSKKTLNMYVNDAIGFGMRPEQVLYYSPNAFGTADAIIFRDNILRIHDLKTGSIPASLKQLEIYAALFCLEYHYKPKDIGMELRIYQNDDILIGSPDEETIAPIMDQIITFDKLIAKMKEEYRG